MIKTLFLKEKDIAYMSTHTHMSVFFIVYFITHDTIQEN